MNVSDVAISASLHWAMSASFAVSAERRLTWGVCKLWSTSCLLSLLCENIFIHFFKWINNEFTYLKYVYVITLFKFSWEAQNSRTHSLTYDQNTHILYSLMSNKPSVELPVLSASNLGSRRLISFEESLFRGNNIVGRCLRTGFLFQIPCSLH